MQLPIPTKEYKIKNTEICVAYYDDRYEITIMSSLGNDAYNSLTIYCLPKEFKKVCQQWLDLLGETT